MEPISRGAEMRRAQFSVKLCFRDKTLKWELFSPVEQHIFLALDRGEFWRVSDLPGSHPMSM